MSIVNQTDIHTIITDPDGTKTLVDKADTMGKELKGLGLTTSQIRALFGEVRQIKSVWAMAGDEHKRTARNRLILLKPKMAYRSRKERGKAVQELVAVLDPALDEVIKEKDTKRQEQNFRRFVDFFEAILAYHKAYGGY